MAEVSSNVVGYYGEDATKGAQKLTMTGVAMTDIAGGALNLNKGFAVDGITGGEDSGYADNILVWDPTGPGGYLTFYFYDDGSESGWTAPDEYYLGDPECAYNTFFKPGKAFWFRPIDANEKTLRFLNPITK